MPKEEWQGWSNRCRYRIGHQLTIKKWVWNFHVGKCLWYEENRMLDYKQYAEKKCWQWLVLNCTIMVDFDLWMKNMIYFICRNNVFYNESLSLTPFLGGQVCFTQPWRVGNWPMFLKAFPLSLPRSPRRRGRGHLPAGLVWNTRQNIPTGQMQRVLRTLRLDTLTWNAVI